MKLHGGRVTVYVDSIAASSASLIAMAGDKIVMREGSLMMIHDPAGMTFGTAEDHRIAINALDRMGQTFAETYAARSGNDVESVRAAMKATTWMTAKEAVDSGYADEAAQDQAIAASPFDYRAYQGAPERLVALSRKNGWVFQRPKAAVSAASTAQQEQPMGKNTTADIEPAEHAVADATSIKDRIKAITGLAEAVGREALASFIAFETEMGVEEAASMLAAAPKAQDSADGADYERHRMAASDLAQPSGDGRTAVSALKPTAIYSARRAALKEA